jgi:hypothetical protein
VRRRAGTADPELPWLRVRLRAQQLDWVAAELAALDRPFVIEHPAELRALVQALARRLSEYAGPGMRRTP